MRAADYIVDIGPGAGVHGGEVVAAGTAAGYHEMQKIHYRRLSERPDEDSGTDQNGADRPDFLPSKERGKII